MYSRKRKREQSDKKFKCSVCSSLFSDEMEFDSHLKRSAKCMRNTHNSAVLVNIKQMDEKNEMHTNQVSVMY